MSYHNELLSVSVVLTVDYSKEIAIFFYKSPLFAILL